MARYALIDGYLETMRSRIHWRRDLEDVVAEMEDHLYSTVEHLLARGSEVGAAQRATLDRFGDPEVLATAYASTDRGGIAVPTSFTLAAGRIGKLAAALFMFVTIAWTLAVALERAGRDWEGDWPWFLFMGGTVALMGSAALIVAFMVGLLRRHGSLGWLGLVAVALAGLGAAATLLSWFVYGWGILLGAGMLLLGAGLLRRGLAPPAATLAFSTGMLLGIGVYLALNALEVGWTDSYGDYPLALALALLTMGVVTGTGLFGLGRWLAGEEPADVDAAALVT